MPELDRPVNYSSLMQKEATEAGKRIGEQLANNKQYVKEISQKIRDYAPHSVMFVGRGSSDHAGSFAKYLIEIETQIPTFSAAPSVASIYGSQLKLKGVLVMIVSQSGRSPDILAQAKTAKEAGALCIALLNDESSPLVDLVDHVIPLFVGDEKSVTATKSYLATLSAILQLVAYWKQGEELATSVDQIPSVLQKAVESTPQLTFEYLNNVTNLVVLGRGLGFAVSKEIALKLKEVCAIHAESFSSAEFLHGPVTLVQSQLKIIDVQIDDESKNAHSKQMQGIKERGANIAALHQVFQGLHPRIAPLAVLQRFYLDIEKIAVKNGLNPDKPIGLKKVTETL